MLILHPFLTGRLARWRRVDAWLEEVLKTRNVWFASLEEIRQHLQVLSSEQGYDARVERLPYYTAPQR